MYLSFKHVTFKHKDSTRNEIIQTRHKKHKYIKIHDLCDTHESILLVI